MAQHIIRDSKGRVDRILDDKEYAEYEKSGCYANIFLFVIICIGVIIYLLSTSNDAKPKGGSEPAAPFQVEYSVPPSSQEGKGEEYSTKDEDNDASPAVEETPVVQEEQTTSVPDVEESPADDSQPEKRLSRKERRALRRAQRNAELELEEKIWQ